MNPKVCLALAVCAIAATPATAILGTIAGEAVGSSLAVGGGIALKAIALTALGADLGLRRKRFAIEDPVTQESTDLAIAAIMSNEPPSATGGWSATWPPETPTTSS